VKRVVYHRLAATEHIKSARFYERRRIALGDEFIAEVDAAILRIQRQPELGPVGKYDERSRRVRRFPFRIVYEIQPDRIWIVAVAHLSRRPGYWIRRTTIP